MILSDNEKQHVEDLLQKETNGDEISNNERRKRTAEDEEEDEEDDEGDEDDENYKYSKPSKDKSPTRSRSKSPSAKKTTRTPKSKTATKGTKKATTPRKSRAKSKREPNMKIKIIEEDDTFDSKSSDYSTNDGVLSTTRNLLRAVKKKISFSFSFFFIIIHLKKKTKVYTKNHELLKKLVADTKNVYSIHIQRSSDLEYETPILIALRNNDLESLKILFEEVKNPLPKRTRKPDSMLETTSTGNYNHYSGKYLFCFCF